MVTCAIRSRFLSFSKVKIRSPGVLHLEGGCAACLLLSLAVARQREREGGKREERRDGERREQTGFTFDPLPFVGFLHTQRCTIGTCCLIFQCSVRERRCRLCVPKSGINDPQFTRILSLGLFSCLRVRVCESVCAQCSTSVSLSPSPSHSLSPAVRLLRNMAVPPKSWRPQYVEFSTSLVRDASPLSLCLSRRGPTLPSVSRARRSKNSERRGRGGGRRGKRKETNRERSSASSHPLFPFMHLQGSFTVELYWDHAPNTCRNFAELVRLERERGGERVRRKRT